MNKTDSDLKKIIEQLLKRIEILEKEVYELNQDRLGMDACSNPRGWKRSIAGKKHELWMKLTTIELNKSHSKWLNKMDIPKFCDNYPMTEDTDVDLVIEELILKNA
jgi:hypothetical protein